MIFFVYIIESLKTGNWYYGHSNDLDRRLAEHNAGQNKSTRGKGPWKLIFKKPFASKSEASKFELELKRFKNKTYIRRAHSNFFIGA